MRSGITFVEMNTSSLIKRTIASFVLYKQDRLNIILNPSALRLDDGFHIKSNSQKASTSPKIVL